MFFALITLLSALSLSAIAAYYSVVGLMAIFTASPIPIAIMGGVLEFSKLIAASWVYKNWTIAPRFLKYYFTIAVVILMLITSLGIFGFLSKAHTDQASANGDVSAKIEIINDKIKIREENIYVIRKGLKQMDEAVDQIMGRTTDEKGAEKSVALRKSQQKERTRLLSEIETEQKIITAFKEEIAPYNAEIRKLDAEVGPIKYIAALAYGEEINTNMLEKAVRFVIILLVLVFDPLAVLLIIAANFSLKQIAKSKAEQSGGYEVNFSPPEKRKRKPVVATPPTDDPSPVDNTTTIDPIPMTQEEVEIANRKYFRDGRPKFRID